MDPEESDTLASDGVTLALLGAMAGALVAQLSELQPASTGTLSRTLGVAFCVIVLCVTAIWAARSLRRSGISVAVLIAIFVVAVFYFFWPEFQTIWDSGSKGLSGAEAKDLAIKIVFTMYILGWSVFYGFMRFISSPRH